MDVCVAGNHGDEHDENIQLRMFPRSLRFVLIAYGVLVYGTEVHTGGLFAEGTPDGMGPADIRREFRNSNALQHRSWGKHQEDALQKMLQVLQWFCMRCLRGLVDICVPTAHM